MGRFQDLTGMRFGRLYVESRAENRIQPGGGAVTRWNCVCDCGNRKVIKAHSLVSGMTKSCGCLQKEITSARSATHKLSDTRLYRIYSAMKTRCYNKNFPEYEFYGGKGIQICDEWLDSFMSFYDWSMENGYGDTLSIDRIDVNGDYCPANCRWADRTTQANNRTNNINITYNGETHTLAEWGRIIGIPYKILKDRVCHYKWNPVRAITQPVRERKAI